ncbi:cryptochrome/photolyase family protein [Litorimonas sp. RW-G-Af-16]|uniref:cryptochrome/photolyase family protein n=1 Tax=Litorimonas sp. RW-G-Af-16 TaxID=3241168 RepID=UPI00390C9B43
MSQKNPIIVWFRRDLRLTDNPALFHANETGQPIILLYIYETNRDREMGAAKRVWLDHSLEKLGKDIADKGGKLLIRVGEAAKILDDVIEQSGADTVMWNRRYTEDGREIDSAIKSDLKERGLTAESFNANLLSEPFKVMTKSGGYYKVFTPYWRAAKDYLDVSDPLPAPKSLNGFAKSLKTEDLPDVEAGDVDGQDWRDMVMDDWTVGEAGAADRLESFLDGPVEDYAEDRNRPDKENGTSRLSPHLAHGEISPRQIWHACKDNEYTSRKFLTEIGWREFSYVLLYHNPKLASENYKSDFDNFPWEVNREGLKRWQRGQTGYPFVDAGMRELYQTGWQHNRVRMVCASFLIKHLLIDWRDGEDWYWDCLLEADPASNAASWQWVAGSGADASPYFRIFNPFTQGEKFDPNGDYVRKYVPELAKMPKKYIHRPWDAPDNVLEYAKVKLGETYPRPIVDHKEARERALAAYKESRS